jgi:hypothetical protein
LSTLFSRQLFQGEIVKLTFSAVIPLGLVVSVFQARPALSQTKPGSIFKVVQTPNENFNSDLFAASASSPNDIWAVGQSAIHFDGAKWTAFQAPFINGENTALLQGVVDISPTLAWAVGNESNNGGSLFQQVIERWDGKEWSVFPNPKFPPNSEATLFATTSTSGNDIWAVGDFVEIDTNLDFNLFEHWDGTAWTATTVQVAENSFESLSGASADAANDAWAVGWAAPLSAGSNEPLAIHWNGTNWVSAVTPHVGEGANQLNAVLALAPNDVWAVGFSTPDAPPQQSATLTLIEHFDGANWAVVPSPNIGPHSVNQSNRLLGLTANSPKDIWAFGSYFAADGSGHQMTLLLHYDGTNWTIAPSPNPTKGNFLDDLLFAGVTLSAGNVWIFGGEAEFQNNHGIETLALHAAPGN